jgi:hypothetical protein
VRLKVLSAFMCLYEKKFFISMIYVMRLPAAITPRVTRRFAE